MEGMFYLTNQIERDDWLFVKYNMTPVAHKFNLLIGIFSEAVKNGFPKNTRIIQNNGSPVLVNRFSDTLRQMRDKLQILNFTLTIPIFLNQLSTK